MSIRNTSPFSLAANLAFAAAAAAFTPLAAQAQAYHDGFQTAGDSIVFVHGTQVGKTRAEVQAELAAWRKNDVQADGWKSLGDGYVFVGHALQSTKTRTEVQAELAEWLKHPVSHDGYLQVGGDFQRYVGRPAAPTDAKLASGAR